MDALNSRMLFTRIRRYTYPGHMDVAGVSYFGLKGTVPFDIGHMDMPRLARAVFPGIPHHVTQRGNRKEQVFFDDDDRVVYLKWLAEYCEKAQVDILSYCLMSNHVHLILRPATKDGLLRVLKPLHTRYAQRINRAMGWQGHVWQGRYFSSPLDDAYTWRAIRYVERNPLRANLVDRAEDYQWSSAAAHCGLTSSQILSPLPAMFNAVSTSEWAGWLALPENDDSVILLRRNAQKGLPCGSDDFINGLEDLADRNLRYRPQGRS